MRGVQRAGPVLLAGAILLILADRHLRERPEYPHPAKETFRKPKTGPSVPPDSAKGSSPREQSPPPPSPGSTLPDGDGLPSGFPEGNGSLSESPDDLWRISPSPREAGREGTPSANSEKADRRHRRTGAPMDASREKAPMGSAGLVREFGSGAFPATERGARLPPGVSVGELRGNREAPPSSGPPAGPALHAEMVQLTREGGGDALEIGFALRAPAPGDPLPNALVLCQHIPEGWSMREADPPADRWDASTRIAKWFVMGENLAEEIAASVTLLRESGSPARDWDTTLAWIVYRLPDGTFVEAEPVRHFFVDSP